MGEAFCRGLSVEVWLRRPPTPVLFFYFLASGVEVSCNLPLRQVTLLAKKDKKNRWVHPHYCDLSSLLTTGKQTLQTQSHQPERKYYKKMSSYILMKENILTADCFINKLSTVLHTLKTNKKTKTRTQNMPILNKM